MKLYFFRRNDGIGNFGDDLNAWLWPRVLGDVLDDDARVAFVGIGTLLNDALPERCGHPHLHIVFGSGVGYAQPLRLQPRETFRIEALRGPVSAQRLGVDPGLALVDPGLLLRRFAPPRDRPGRGVGFMPHVEQAMANGPLWRRVCERARITYIDPRDPIEAVLDALGSIELLLSEAMHGAIAAEALGVPWIALRLSRDVLQLKWIDWCASLRLTYAPVTLQAPPQAEREAVIASLAAWLQTVPRSAPPQQASPARSEALLIRLEERLDRFRQDCQAGDFGVQWP